MFKNWQRWVLFLEIISFNYDSHFLIFHSFRFFLWLFLSPLCNYSSKSSKNSMALNPKLFSSVFGLAAPRQDQPYGSCKPFHPSLGFLTPLSPHFLSPCLATRLQSPNQCLFVGSLNVDFPDLFLFIL